ncbi:MAG: undecaprenyldiphospho-muramoylpentapeptide beta-N-acetylglucosaminyltransferase [Proteobacteria bacterium]|nr:undecaprenyldiphospho-muramoylpentapeptide beta-N-acetylglucosaminyltransferase [Pseudomonadota bacterium]
MTALATTARPILLTAGGTGGHMFPALAVAEVLGCRGHRLVLVTDDRGARFAKPFGDIERHIVPAADLARGRIKGFINLVRGVLAAYRLYGTIRPAAVMGFGGYASFPALIAARLRRIPFCIHEQNAVLGRVNRTMAESADRIALSVRNTQRLEDEHKNKSILTGNPVRDEVRVLQGQAYTPPKADGIFRILVLGGSQGAKILSDVIPLALALLPEETRHRLQITQQCRPETLEDVRRLYGDAEIAHDVATFFSDVASRLSWTHLVIARAGASTISEIEVASRPSILVPLPTAADDHQTANAQDIDDAGGAWMVSQDEFTPEALAARITELMNAPELLVRAAVAARSQARPDAAERLADLMEGLAEPNSVDAGAKQSRDAGGAPNHPRMIAEAA